MKKLGQHFLKNHSAIKKIVAALDLRPDDVVVEIGAGHGELTRELQILNPKFEIRNKGRVIAIEKDKKLAEQLEKTFADNKNIEFISGDALKILTPLIADLKIDNCKLKIVGNIPYYITGRLLRILSEAENKPSLCVFTIQKEVAERICAVPPRMNRLAAITQFWTRPETLFYIPRKDFSPQPDVDSAVIKFNIMEVEPQYLTKNYYKTVKILFAQPRKTILNNLATSDRRQEIRKQIEEKLREVGINPNDRPQNLSVEEMGKISKIFNF